MTIISIVTNFSSSTDRNVFVIVMLTNRSKETVTTEMGKTASASCGCPQLLFEAVCLHSGFLMTSRKM